MRPVDSDGGFDRPLLLDRSTRHDLWRRLAEILETYVESVAARPVAVPVIEADVRAFLETFSFAHPVPATDALDLAAKALMQYQVHSAHPRYFGLFTPAPTTMGIAADALVAAFNPQLAGWTHSPFAIELEQHLIRMLARWFGWDGIPVEGTFTTGGSEANYTAVVSGINAICPSVVDDGVRSLQRSPVLYTSTDGHDSIVKAAVLCGLGRQAVRRIPTDGRWRMDVSALAKQIESDRLRGELPCLVVATAGTTSTGAIDPIDDVAEITERHGMWLHVDAAWGGAVAIVPELRRLLLGINRADSITFDAHKWLAVPMGAGLYMSRRTGLLNQALGCSAPGYATHKADVNHVDPYSHTLQWSRRFSGLKLFLSLLVAGWDGYRSVIRHQTEMGDKLRSELAASRWHPINQTPLPLVCFVDDEVPMPETGAYVQQIADAVVRSGDAWISTVTVGSPPLHALRACVTNYRTGPDDIHALVRALNTARETVRALSPTV